MFAFGNYRKAHLLIWHSRLNSSPPPFLSESSLYPANDPPIVTIEGQALSCIINVNHATFTIKDDSHLITILGNNNTIIVNGSGIKLRVEGDDNFVGGPGKKLLIFADPEKVTVNGEMEGVNQVNLRDTEGNIVADAPEPLELPPSLRAADWQRCFRYAYRRAKYDDGSEKVKAGNYSDDEDQPRR